MSVLMSSKERNRKLLYTFSFGNTDIKKLMLVLPMENNQYQRKSYAYMDPVLRWNSATLYCDVPGYCRSCCACKTGTAQHNRWANLERARTTGTARPCDRNHASRDTNYHLREEVMNEFESTQKTLAVYGCVSVLTSSKERNRKFIV